MLDFIDLLNRRHFPSNTNNFNLPLQLPPNCTWQTLRDEFRTIGEVKFAEIRGQDCGVVRFSKERDAELAISKWTGPSQ